LSYLFLTPHDRDASAPTALAQKRRRAAARPRILWCMPADTRRDQGRLFVPALARFGVAADQVLIVETKRPRDSLWVLEEAARSGAVSAIVGAVDELDFTQSRRLTLAATHGKTPLFLLRHHGCAGATAAFSRWCVQTLPSAPDPLEAGGPGQQRYQADLLRCRYGALQKQGVFATAHADAPHADAPRADAPRADAPRADAPHTGTGSEAPSGEKNGRWILTDNISDYPTLGSAAADTASYGTDLSMTPGQQRRIR
jgi:hypothetical protein